MQRRSDRSGEFQSRDRAIARVAAEWRRLTSGKSARSGRRLGPGEPTLVACSGGADSSALVLALAAATDRIVVAHIIHDMRPAPETAADRDAVRALADRLDLKFVERAISVYPSMADRPVNGEESPARRPGHSTRNIERLARDRRYAALADMARELGISYVATGHHAQDQLETLLMRLMRGAGPTGLCGIARKRLLRRVEGAEQAKQDGATDDPPPIWLIRPMLDLSRLDAERICHASDWSWRVDATNADTGRLRSALRHRVIPELARLSPGVERRASASVEQLRDAAGLLKRHAAQVSRQASIVSANTRPNEQEPAIVWQRDRLQGHSTTVLGEIMRDAASRLLRGERNDRQRHRELAKIAEAIRGQSREPRRYILSGIEIVVSATRVEMKRTQE